MFLRQELWGSNAQLPKDSLSSGSKLVFLESIAARVISGRIPELCVTPCNRIQISSLIFFPQDDQPLKIAAPERADDPHYNVKADSRILLINDAVDTDIGKYTCVYPPTGRHDFFVNVLAKPYFYSHDGLLPPEIYQLQDGQSVVVNCSARGNPEPTVCRLFMVYVPDSLSFDCFLKLLLCIFFCNLAFILCNILDIKIIRAQLLSI